MSELRTRVAVGAALAATALASLLMGGVALWVLASALGVIMMGEWAKLTGAADHARLAQYAVSVPLAIMSPWAAGPGFVAIGLIAAAFAFLAIVTRKGALAAGIVYVCVPVMALLWLRGQQAGLLLALWALASVWATDIGAYFAGRAIGGPRVAPAISPNKTWAGLGGGILAALLLGWVLVRWAGLSAELALFAPLLAVLAQAGDFFESWLKRRAGVKDSGTLFPGHGGALDRLDGAVAALPLAALLVLVQLPGDAPADAILYVDQAR